MPSNKVKQTNQNFKAQYKDIRLAHEIQLQRNYHKQSLLTSRCLIFPSFYFLTNQFGIQNLRQPNRTKYNPINFTILI
jgi:hypothetical protein